MATDPASALAFLAARGLSVKSTNAGYLSRLVRNVTRQEASGLPLNRQAARGHVYTPEHPGRRRPIIPDNPRDYSPRKSRYTVATRPLEPRLRPALTIKRPRVHSRDISMPEAMIEVPGHSLIVTTNSQREAMRLIRQHRSHVRTIRAGTGTRTIAAPKSAPGMSWRVRIDAYDCSRRTWAQIFTNRGHKQGIGVDYLLSQLTDSELSLEEYLIRAAIDSGSGAHALLSHICSYTLVFVPADEHYFQ